MGLLSLFIKKRGLPPPSKEDIIMILEKKMEALEKENRELKRKLESISHGRSSAKPEQEVSAFRSELPCKTGDGSLSYFATNA